MDRSQSEIGSPIAGFDLRTISGKRFHQTPFSQASFGFTFQTSATEFCSIPIRKIAPDSSLYVGQRECAVVPRSHADGMLPAQEIVDIFCIFEPFQPGSPLSEATTLRLAT